ncbi:sulfur carrier protein ThiS [Brevibacillus laterosporus]|nr:sulfur carrier protein ThiS [Brevibacillus laterosporus]
MNQQDILSGSCSYPFLFSIQWTKRLKKDEEEKHSRIKTRWIPLQANTVQIQVNGKTTSIEKNSTVEQLLIHYGLEQRIVVVEHNQIILDRSSYAQTTIMDDDRIEIVHFVGGG